MANAFASVARMRLPESDVPFGPQARPEPGAIMPQLAGSPGRRASPELPPFKDEFNLGSLEMDGGKTTCVARTGSCSLPSTPQQAAPARPSCAAAAPLPAIRVRAAAEAEHLAAQPAGRSGGADHHCDGADDEGWFFSCRGCGAMTAYECCISGADVPFCRRCQHLLAGAAPDMQARMRDTLLYVHAAWARAGL